MGERLADRGYTVILTSAVRGRHDDGRRIAHGGRSSPDPRARAVLPATPLRRRGGRLAGVGRQPGRRAESAATLRGAPAHRPGLTAALPVLLLLSWLWVDQAGCTGSCYGSRGARLHACFGGAPCTS